VARLGGHCHEGEGAFHLVRTDGWAERSLGSGLLVVGVAVRPVLLRQAGVDPDGFPERSAIDPDAVPIMLAPPPSQPPISAS
jgi:hypothetical protein